MGLPKWIEMDISKIRIDVGEIWMDFSESENPSKSS